MANISLKIMFPKTEKEKLEATRAVESGKAISGESSYSQQHKKPKEEIDLNEDEEAALDAVWEKRDKVSNVDTSGGSDLKSVRAKYKKK